MSASAAVRGDTGVPLENFAFPWAEFPANATCNGSREQLAASIRRVLMQVGLTMTQVSAATGMRFGRNSRYFVPPTFLHKQRKGITPHICQLAALSLVTGYRLADWMKLCGFDLSLILALQLKIHKERTVLITPEPALARHDPSPESVGRAPLTSERRYLFAKIGSRDAVADRRFLPGTIVRANPGVPLQANGLTDDRLWLVEHPGGLACCHVKPVDNDQVVLLPNRPPLSPWPLRRSVEVQILGLVDLALRPERPAFEPVGPSANSHSGSMACALPGGLDVPKLLRLSRRRAGLTLRAAHRLTLLVARLLRNRDCRIALGLLSDYEVMDTLPRHIAKFVSLCAVYSIDPWELMRAGGIDINDSGRAILFPADRGSDRPENA